MEPEYSLAILGVGVMGRSLALNFERHGYRVIGYDPTPNLPPNFDVKVVESVEVAMSALRSPRICLLMVPAGATVDVAIDSMKPYLSPGDVIIDGGNSFYTDTERRVVELKKDGIHFIGMGVSGGESGALWGPSLMPGGAAEAWPMVKTMLRAIAAVADDGEPCVSWMGPGGVIILKIN